VAGASKEAAVNELFMSEDGKNYIGILEKMIEPLDWDDFQAIPDGNIHYWNERTGTVCFYYRVGLHMKRPMEAIMAKGQFIRFRPAPDLANFHLERLDPDNVNNCLYDHRWQPKTSTQYATMQQAIFNQQQLHHQLAQQQLYLDQYNTGTIYPATHTVISSGGSGGGIAPWSTPLSNGGGGYVTPLLGVAKTP
jgi:hypothetical protein